MFYTVTKRFIACFSLVLLFAMYPIVLLASTLIEHVSGFILLDVENHGEAWYVDPVERERSFLGRPDDAFVLMRTFGLGISDADLALLPTVSDSSTGDLVLRKRLSGRILLQVEQNGEAWYVYPKDLKRYYLGRPSDAFALMRQVGLGISQADLANVPVAQSFLSAVSKYENDTLTLPEGAFAIHLLTLNKKAFAMQTDTSNATDCSQNCPVQSLESFVQENQASFGVNGSYFCPASYPDCATKINTFFSPVFNSSLDIMLNESSLDVHEGPLFVYTTDGSYYYFHRTAEFGSSVENFEARTGKTVAGAIANYPSLIENGQVIVLNERRLDEQQKTIKGVRAGIGMNEDQLFIVIASSATVPDLAAIFTSLGATSAMNLDGGGSAALYVNGVYRFGPGRLLPNAITFVPR